MGVVEPRNVARRNRRARWARFTFNGITRYERGTYDLVGGVAEGFCAAVELSDAEREELLQLCRQRLDAFRMQRGEEVGCLLTQKPAASGTGAATAPRSAVRSKSGCSPVQKAAANAAGRAVAWQTPQQRALEVDPIVPRNRGGSDDLSNLQALCFRCNAGTLKGQGRRSALRSSSPVGRPRP
jgi:ATP adenylyltransferase